MSGSLTGLTSSGLGLALSSLGLLVRSKAASVSGVQLELVGGNSNGTGSTRP